MTKGAYIETTWKDGIQYDRNGNPCDDWENPINDGSFSRPVHMRMEGESGLNGADTEIDENGNPVFHVWHNKGGNDKGQRAEWKFNIVTQEWEFHATDQNKSKLNRDRHQVDFLRDIHNGVSANSSNAEKIDAGYHQDNYGNWKK